MGNRLKSSVKRVLSAALCVMLLFALLPGSASAVNDEGLTVEKLSFRDVLRLYTLDRASFGVDALETDAYGVTNAAKRLAEMFAFTVGLNYDGKGLNSNYFGKDITASFGSEPYTDASLLATYEVEISPYRSYAVALPEGKTTAIRVYLAGYENAATGVVPVLHYVWREGGAWYAVKDDNPYYRVSYNGNSARQLSGSGLILAHTRAASGGTDSLQTWTNLTEAADGGGIVHLDSCTLVAGQGTANLFGVTRDMSALRAEGGYSSSLLAVSDFVQGDTTYQTGPLVYSRSVYEADSMRRVTDGEALREGVTYLFRVVYDEALTVLPGADRDSVGVQVRSEVTGQTKAVDSFTWYGSASYLTGDRYNPHTVEFTFTPADEGYGVCTFLPVNLVGSESALKAADFHACVKTGPAPTPAPTAVPAPTGAPTAAPTPAATAVPETPAASEIPVETAVPVTPAPTAPATPTATLSVLFDAADDALLTRGALAQTLWILSGQPIGDIQQVYSDLPEDSAAAQAIVWMGRTGLIEGYADGTFRPDYIITREQAAVILGRYAALCGLETYSGSDLSPWTDGAAVSALARDAVVWALGTGILTARSDGRIAPNDAVLCGEAIEMIRTFQQRR